MLAKWYDNEISIGIMTRKYLHDGETTEDFIPRLVSIFSDDLKDKAKKVLENADFLPAGRTLYGAGFKDKRKVSMSNCYILPTPEDNIESIFETAKRIARISSYGGGCGIDISKLRPKDSKVNNSAKTSTGAVSFLNLFNTTAGTIGQNGRRAALMVALDCTHPDIEEFLHIKQNNQKLASMNISIKFTNEFMEEVKNNKEFTLKFKTPHETITKTINAREFFIEFCKTQWDWGDPGALFIDRIRSFNLLSGYPEYRIDVSNPCVTGDTVILTNKGYERIKSLCGKETTVWNGYEWSKVVPRITGHNQKMLRVTVSNGMSLDCTRYHKFIMVDGSRVKAEELNVGDKLAKWEYPVIDGNDEYIGHDAYTNGFYSGDGTKGVNEIAVYGNKVSIIPYLNTRLVEKYNEKQDRTLVVLNEDPIGKTFVPAPSSTKRYKLNWLAGLIDADGTRNDVGGSVSVTSVNKEFLKNVQLMVTSLGCHSSVIKDRDESDRELPMNNGTGGKQLYHCQATYRLVISAWYVRKLLDMGLNTHRVDIDPHPDRNAGRFITVTSIKEIPDEETVYCFTEPKNHSGVFNGIMTAQCAEFMGNGGNSCNLGSINLYNVIDNKFSREACVNYDRLKSVTDTAVRILDEILDYGRDMQPLEINKECIDNWRSIGLGVFGLADALVAMKIRYGSKESRLLISDIMDTIMEQALTTSAILAKEKGTFKCYDWNKTKGSQIIKAYKGTKVYSLIEKYGLRNGTLLSIAPTGTISLFAGRFTGGVEPMYKVAYERTTHSTEDQHKHFFVYARGVEDLLKYYHMSTKNTPVDVIKKKFPFVVESHEINPMERVALQGVMQDYVDNAISSTVNLPNSVTWEEIYDIYLAAWEQGLKGITVFRDGCKRGNILGVKPETKEVTTYNSILPTKRRNKKRINGATFRQSTSCVESMYVTVNKTDDGDVFEVFTNPSGGCKSNIGTITRLISLALRSGIKVNKVIEELRENKCPACQVLRRQGKDVSLSCANAIADAMEQMITGEEEANDVKTSDEFKECPECHRKTLRPEGKCWTCSSCGYNACE